jgi:hypothetical protein
VVEVVIVVVTASVVDVTDVVATVRQLGSLVVEEFVGCGPHNSVLFTEVMIKGLQQLGRGNTHKFVLQATVVVLTPLKGIKAF